MDIVEFIKREHAKISILIMRLADTSDTAIKSRERLVSLIKSGLDAHMSVVQEHIYPLLRKSDETRDLVPDLKERNDLKRQLVDLERTPKNDEGFLGKVKEVKKTIEQHLRAEERQIFPAIKKGIGGEEAEELAKRIAAQTGELLQAAKDQAEETMATGAGANVVEIAANGAAEGAQRLGRAVERTAETAGKNVDALSRGVQDVAAETVETGRRAMDGVAAGTRRLAEGATQQVEGTARRALNAAELYSQTGRRVTEDLRLMTAPAAAAGALREMQKVWMDWLAQAAQTNTRTAQALLRCTTLQQVAEVHRDALAENLDAWLSGGARVLRTVHQTSGEMLRPLEERIEKTVREDRREVNSDRRDAAA